MSTVTVSTGLQRAAMLTPFRAAGRSYLTGDYGAVCSYPPDMPEQFREAQRRRNLAYMSTGARNEPADAVRYYVTSYGVPIAWVTLDGRTHYIDDVQPFWYREVTDSPAQTATMTRHIDAIRASWPDRFVMNSQGDPEFRRYPDGTWQPLPADEPSIVNV